ncbi:hypothetical protein R3P38DRAFT_3235107 [Favolaschia claudopus]|uniref:Uncharacterized protein n=1 Tax=Favolaschia claudopus TaxID=2862362 RepID=A0AAV9ZEW2_9AGAR
MEVAQTFLPTSIITKINQTSKLSLGLRIRKELRLCVNYANEDYAGRLNNVSVEVYVQRPLKVLQVVLLGYIAVLEQLTASRRLYPGVCFPSIQALLANSMSGQRPFTPLSPPQLSALDIGFSSGPPYWANLKPFNQVLRRFCSLPPSPSLLPMAQRPVHRPQQQSMHLPRSHCSRLVSRTPPRVPARAVVRRMLYGRQRVRVAAAGQGWCSTSRKYSSQVIVRSSTLPTPEYELQLRSPRHSSTRRLGSTSVTARTIGRSFTNAMTLVQVLLQSLLQVYLQSRRSLWIGALPADYDPAFLV